MGCRAATVGSLVQFAAARYLCVTWANLNTTTGHFNFLKQLADPTRFERATFAFGVRIAGVILAFSIGYGSSELPLEGWFAVSVVARRA